MFSSFSRVNQKSYEKLKNIKYSKNIKQIEIINKGEQSKIGHKKLE